MNELITKLKSIKNATQSQYDEVINKYSQAEVLKELTEAGISKEDISQEEFDELLEEKIKESKAFSKGAMVAGGAFLFLELLG
jgi:tRNA A37 N6-isopentenylltransferase MiaA